MLKWVGAVCVIGGAALLGLRTVSGLNRHALLLRQLRDALGLMRSEIRFSLTPVPTLLEQLGHRQSGPVGTFFLTCAGQMERLGDQSFGELWHCCIEEELGPFLNREELRTLSGLGEVLGRYDAEEQVNGMTYVLERLEQFCRTADEERSRLGRVYGTMSVLCGIAVVIILI